MVLRMLPVEPQANDTHTCETGGTSHAELAKPYAQTNLDQCRKYAITSALQTCARFAATENAENINYSPRYSYTAQTTRV